MEQTPLEVQKMRLGLLVHDFAIPLADASTTHENLLVLRCVFDSCHKRIVEVLNELKRVIEKFPLGSVCN